MYKKFGEAYYIDIYTPQGTLEICSSELYQMLHNGDKVIVKIQKGRFDHYYALSLKVEKNHYLSQL